MTMFPFIPGLRETPSIVLERWARCCLCRWHPAGGTLFNMPSADSRTPSSVDHRVNAW